MTSPISLTGSKSKHSVSETRIYRFTGMVILDSVKPQSDWRIKYRQTRPLFNPPSLSALGWSVVIHLLVILPIAAIYLYKSFDLGGIFSAPPPSHMQSAAPIPLGLGLEPVTIRHLPDGKVEYIVRVRLPESILRESGLIRPETPAK